MDLGTLAARTLVSAPISDTVQERTLVSSVVTAWAISDFTSAAGTGPFAVGVAHSDYTDAEIEAVLENTGSWDEGDLVQQEVAKRKVRRIGVINTPDGAATKSFVLNDGDPIKTKLNWILTQGQTLRIWVYNLGDAAIATTDPDITVSGHANLWPTG